MIANVLSVSVSASISAFPLTMHTTQALEICQEVLQQQQQQTQQQLAAPAHSMLHATRVSITTLEEVVAACSRALRQMRCEMAPAHWQALARGGAAALADFLEGERQEALPEIRRTRPKVGRKKERSEPLGVG